jgi:hypothetical protein
MYYSQYTSLRAIRQRLGVQISNHSLFVQAPKVEPSDWLLQTWKRTLQNRVGFFSEKARSEAIVFPLLIELKTLHKDMFTLYSGAILDADKERGLSGECDFILGFSRQNIEIEAPVFCIVEAKDNDLELGVPQCIAQMLGARLFNEQEQLDFPSIYGCVTTGETWLFLRLEGNRALIDTRQFYLDRPDELLGIFDLIIKTQAAYAPAYLSQ